MEMVDSNNTVPSAYPWVPTQKRKWIVQLILFIVDSGCTKHMTGNLSLLCNFVEKYLGTVRFGNDQFAPILGYGDLVQGNITIKRVYLRRRSQSTIFSSGNQLTNRIRGTDLYTISLQETTSSAPICLMAKASPTQAWLWHRRLSHLNFDYINLLSKKDVVIGLPKLKGTEFLKQDTYEFFKKEGIEHANFSTPRTPEQNALLKDKPHSSYDDCSTTMLSASKLLISLG
ncbi:integrase, catalytic region, zinc finger, CCHC-type containing protein [Tanacetum coccineum]